MIGFRGERVIGIAENPQMADTVKFWQAARSRDTQELARYIQWSDGRAYIQFPFDDSEALVLETSIRGKTVLPFGDSVLAALHVIQDVINEKIRPLAAPRLVWDSDFTRLRMQIYPKNLLGAMWVELLLAVANDKDYICCQGCKEWREVTTQVRPNSKHCSDACRSLAYRNRKRKRKILSGEGTLETREDLTPILNESNLNVREIK